MRDKRCFGTFVLALMLLTAADPCSARYINLDIKPKAEFIERFLAVSATITNGGDEPAYKVHVAVEAEGRSVTLPGIDQIGVNEQRTVSATLPVGAVGPGSYTAVLRVGYMDTNGYAFSTLTVASVTKEVNPPPLVTATLKVGDVTSSGEVLVQVRNLVRRGTPVRIRLVSARELTVTPAEARIVLEGGQEQRLRFGVRNASALPGSSYAVFAVLDADAQGVHMSTTQAAHIPILAYPTTPSSTVLIAALAATPIMVLLVIRLARSAARRMRRLSSHRGASRRVSG